MFSGLSRGYLFGPSFHFFSCQNFLKKNKIFLFFLKMFFFLLLLSSFSSKKKFFLFFFLVFFQICFIAGISIRL